MVIMQRDHPAASSRQHRLRRRQAVERSQESPALRPQQSQADENDQHVAGDFDPAHGLVHRLGGRPEDDRGHAHDRHGDHRLQQRRRERQHDAAPPRLLVGDEV
jgi:hypothetical protein